MKHHLLPNVICSGVVDGKAKTVNALNKYVILERDEQVAIWISFFALSLKFRINKLVCLFG
jgi:hypothetical protein